MGMGAILLFMGGHGWVWMQYDCSWVGMGSILSWVDMGEHGLKQSILEGVIQ